MLQLGLCGKWAFIPAPSMYPERQPVAPDYTEELEFTVYRLLRSPLTITALPDPRVHACQPPPLLSHCLLEWAPCSQVIQEIAAEAMVHETKLAVTEILLRGLCYHHDQQSKSSREAKRQGKKARPINGLGSKFGI